MAARKVSEFISCLVSGDELTRKKFSYTWNGEHRIEHCKKIDLVGGYRLVLIQKDHDFIFLYAGSHDDCFRWIERNKGLSYEVDDATHASIIAPAAGKDRDTLSKDVLEEKMFVERYKKSCWRSSTMIFLKGYLPDDAKMIRTEITSHKCIT